MSRKLTYEELEKAAGLLASRVIWALNYCKATGAVMNMVDSVGHVVDRRAYFDLARAGAVARRRHLGRSGGGAK